MSYLRLLGQACPLGKQSEQHAGRVSPGQGMQFEAVGYALRDVGRQTS